MFLIKFSHGVEVGAYNAYMGHYAVTKDPVVLAIAQQEWEHMNALCDILEENGERPSWLISGLFWLIGTTVMLLCHVSPRFMLNRIARLLELFAVFNYEMLAEHYPKYRVQFLEMAVTERDHEQYFAGAGVIKS